jgi:polar amino acid transport system substrate-binding protein
MKKVVATVLAAVAVCSTMSFVACTTPTPSADNNKGVKVYKSILLTEEDYAFAIKKENTDLKTSVNELIADMKEDGSLDELIDSYFDGTATFTYTNKTSAPAADDFVMATNAYFPPFEYYEGEAFKGVDVEMAYKIAQKLGKNLFVKDMDFDTIIADVKNGASDIGMAGMTVTDERLEQVDFATPYYKSAQVLTVKVGNTKFDGCTTAEQVENILKAQSKSFKIGTQTGTTGYMYSAGDEDFGYDGFKNLTTKSYQTGALAMTDLDNGRIDAVILDLQPSLMIAQSINAKYSK